MRTLWCDAENSGQRHLRICFKRSTWNHDSFARAMAAMADSSCFLSPTNHHRERERDTHCSFLSNAFSFQECNQIDCAPVTREGYRVRPWPCIWLTGVGNLPTIIVWLWNHIAGSFTLLLSYTFLNCNRDAHFSPTVAAGIPGTHGQHTGRLPCERHLAEPVLQ